MIGMAPLNMIIVVLVPIFNPLIWRRPLESDNTTDIIATFHIGNGHILSVDIADIIILVKDECSIHYMPIIITDISVD